MVRGNRVLDGNSSRWSIMVSLSTSLWQEWLLKLSNCRIMLHRKSKLVFMPTSQHSDEHGFPHLSLVLLLLLLSLVSTLVPIYSGFVCALALLLFPSLFPVTTRFPSPSLLIPRPINSTWGPCLRTQINSIWSKNNKITKK